MSDREAPPLTLPPQSRGGAGAEAGAPALALPAIDTLPPRDTGSAALDAAFTPGAFAATPAHAVPIDAPLTLDPPVARGDWALRAEDRIGPPPSKAGRGGLVLAAIAVVAMMGAAGSAYVLFGGADLAQQAPVAKEPVAIAGVTSPATQASQAPAAASQPIETGSLAQPAAVTAPAPVVAAAPPALVEPPPSAAEPAPIAAAAPSPATVAPLIAAVPPPVEPPVPVAPKILNAPPGMAQTPSPVPPRASSGAASAPPAAASPPAPKAASLPPPVKPAPLPSPQKVAKADAYQGSPAGRPLPPVSDLPPARPAIRTPPSGLASESLSPPGARLAAPGGQRDTVQKRAVAAGLHPKLPRDLLERLTPNDLRNAGVAVQTAVNEAPDGQVFVYPRDRRPDEAFYQVRLLPAVHPECRRYVVTVTKDGWSTTAPPMENCEVIGRRDAALPPPDGPPPLRR